MGREHRVRTLNRLGNIGGDFTANDHHHPQNRTKTIAKRALQMLTGILATSTATLTGTTGLLEAWNKLSPLIKSIFGL